MTQIQPNKKKPITIALAIFMAGAILSSSKEQVSQSKSVNEKAGGKKQVLAGCTVPTQPQTNSNWDGYGPGYPKGVVNNVNGDALIPVGTWYGGVIIGGTRWILQNQPDGNLVLYDTNVSISTSIWNSGTQGHPNAKWYLQGDGNLVAYDNGNAIWSSNTHVFNCGGVSTERALIISLDGQLQIIAKGVPYDAFNHYGYIVLATSNPNGGVPGTSSTKFTVYGRKQ